MSLIRAERLAKTYRTGEVEVHAVRGIDFTIEPWMCSDAGAAVSDVIRIDCAALIPMVAAPGDPGIS